MNDNLKLWMPESGWKYQDASKNAVLLEENNMLTTENFRSIYYNLEVPKNSGTVEITLDIYTENCFRILLCNTTNTRNPLESKIYGIFGKTVLLHINHILNKKQIISETFDSCADYGEGSVIAENAGTKKNYHIVILLDYSKKQNDEDWICVTITDPETGHTYTDAFWVSGISETDNNSVAQIKVIFKTYKRNRAKTYLKDFSIKYDEEAEKNTAEIKDFKEIEKEYEELSFSLDKMWLDTESLSVEDTVNNIGMKYSCQGTAVLFPLYRYKDKNIYFENDMNVCYDSGERKLKVYPVVNDKVREAAASMNNLTKEEEIEYLLSVLNGTIEPTAEERIAALELENAEIIMDMGYQISCLELGL